MPEPIKLPENVYKKLKEQVDLRIEKGYSKEQINAYIGEVKKKYAERTAVPYKEDLNSPSWFKESHLKIKERNKKRGFINKTINSIKNAEYNPLDKDFWGQGFETEGKQEKDVISPEMVNEVDKWAKGALREDGTFNSSINVKEYVSRVEDHMNRKYN